MLVNLKIGSLIQEEFLEKGTLYKELPTLHLLFTATGFPKTMLNFFFGYSFIVLHFQMGLQCPGVLFSHSFLSCSLLFFVLPCLPNSKVIKQNKKETVRIKGEGDQRFVRVLRDRRIKYVVSDRVTSLALILF